MLLIQKKMGCNLYYFSYTFLGLVFGFTFSLIAQIDSELWNLLRSPEGARLPLLVIAGAFGGLLRSLQTNCLTVSNCLIGIGGALIVFLIVPVQITQMTITELLGTALIGGYGGGSLLNQALQSITDRVDETSQKLAEAEKEIQKANQKIAANEMQNKIDAETLDLLSRYLDKSLDISQEGETDLMNNIDDISNTTRKIVFEKTQGVFYIIRDQLPKEKKIIENALKVFEKLRYTDKSNDRYAAHAGYAYMELEEWNKAIELLEEAKRKLKMDNNKGHNDQNEIVYNAHLVVCQIQLSPENKEEIVRNLSNIKDLKNIIPLKYNNLIKDFIEKNKVTFAE